MSFITKKTSYMSLTRKQVRRPSLNLRPNLPVTCSKVTKRRSFRATPGGTALKKSFIFAGETASLPSGTPLGTKPKLAPLKQKLSLI